MGALSYSDWADLLAAHLLQPTNAKRPVFLYADDTLIADLAQTDDEVAAVEAFVTAVRSEFDRPGGDPFRPIVIKSEQWFAAARNDSPYCLPLLISFVLAASRMVAGDGFAAHNYYVRLRSLLKMPGEGRPPGFDWASTTLWPSMRRWLDTTMDGELGTATIPREPALPYVGYPLSQALWRTSDRNRFYEFLGAMFEDVATLPPAADLIAALQVWARREGGFSGGARLLLSRLELQPLLEETVGGLIEAWDGTVPGRVRATGLRVLASTDHLGRINLGVAIGPAELREGPFEDPEGRRIEVEQQGRWLVPSGVDAKSLLEAGLTLRSDAVRARHDPADIHIMVQDADLGAWVQSKSAPSGMELRILVRDKLYESVRRYLDQWSAVASTERDVLGTDWRLMSGIRLKPERSRASDPRLVDLAPPPGDIFELRRGLSVASGKYLVGAGPDVVMRTGFRELRLAVFVDEALVGELGTERPVPLRTVTSLGHHVVSVGATTRTFELVEVRAGAASTRLIERTIGPLTVVGAASEPSDTSGPMTLSRREGHELIGAVPGHYLDVEPWAKPGWMLRLDREPENFEFWPDFEVVFCVSRYRGERTVKVAQRLAPDLGRSTTGARTWARAVLAMPVDRVGPNTRRMVEAYRQRARAILRVD